MTNRQRRTAEICRIQFGSILKCLLKLQQIYLNRNRGKQMKWLSIFGTELCLSTESITSVLHVFLFSFFQFFHSFSALILSRLVSNWNGDNDDDNKQSSHNKENDFFMKAIAIVWAYWNRFAAAVWSCVCNFVLMWLFLCCSGACYCACLPLTSSPFSVRFIWIEWLGADILIDYFSFIFVSEWVNGCCV